jgi:hypothetical protein
MLTKGINEGFQDSDLAKGVVTGYFAKFGSKDLDGDIIEKGAFQKTSMERGPGGKKLIKYLLDHDKTKAVARVDVLQEDNQGLYYEAKIGSHALGQDFQKMVESGIINQHSFGFSIPKDKSYYDKSRNANIIKEVIMYEGSALQFLGANPDTTDIFLKTPEQILISIDNFKELIIKMKSFVKTSDATDETILLIEKSMNNLIEQDIKSLQDILKPSKDTLNDKEADKQIIIETLKNAFKDYGNIRN